MNREASGAPLTSDDHAAILTVYGSGDELEKQRARIRAARSLMNRAGSTRELQAAERRAERAEEAHAKRLPELRQAIARLQVEAEEIETERHTADRELQARREAREELLGKTRLLPAHLAERYNFLKRALRSSSSWAHLQSLKSRLRQIDQIPDLGMPSGRYEDSQAGRALLAVIGKLQPDDPVRQTQGSLDRAVSPEVVGILRDRLTDEKVEVSEALASAEQAIAPQLAELEDIASYHLKRLDTGDE